MGRRFAEIVPSEASFIEVQFEHQAKMRTAFLFWCDKGKLRYFLTTALATIGSSGVVVPADECTDPQEFILWDHPLRSVGKYSYNIERWGLTSYRLRGGVHTSSQNIA